MSDTQQQHRPDTISWLSEELRIRVTYISDFGLQQEVVSWLRDAATAPSRDVMDHVETHLSAVRLNDDDDDHPSQHPMRRLEADGEADFPNACHGCPHFGTRCPVFIDPDERRRRHQLQDELANASTSRVQQAYRRYAEQNDCHQITAALTEWSDGHEQTLIDGLDLYDRVLQETDVGQIDEQAEAQQVVEETTGGAD